MSHLVHRIWSFQPMMVERRYALTNGELDLQESEIGWETGEPEEFECECGKKFDTRSEAEAHVEQVMP